MRLIDADTVKEALRNRISEDIDECINNVPTVDVLDKIRAEIKLLSNANPSYWHSGDMVEREEVLDIIDKYKGDKE